MPVVLIVGGVLALLTMAGAAAIALAVFANQPVAQAPTSAVVPPPTVVPPPIVIEPPFERKPEPPKPEPPKLPEPKKPEEKPKPEKVPPKYAAVVPQEIKPAKLADDRVTVNLPGKVAATCVGGGGRYFILHLSGESQLAVFDVNQAKVVKHLPLESDKVKFAAGMNKLIVAYPEQGTLVRYDLGTFAREATGKCPVDGTIRGLAMGSASAGPVFVALYGKDRFGTLHTSLAFLDPATLAEVDIAPPPPQPRWTWQDTDTVRASPDGRTFTYKTKEAGTRAISVAVDKTTAADLREATRYIVPGGNGLLYTGNGRFTADGKRADRVDNGGNGRPFLPSAEGRLTLRLLPAAGEFDPLNSAALRWKGEVLVAGDWTVFTFRDLGEFAISQWPTGDLPPDERFHFAPTANLLVQVPASNDRLVLHKFDLSAAYEQSGVDYLYVTSHPPAALGRMYSYQIIARSKKGGVKFKLDTGPKGMAVSPGGLLTWAVPADFAAPVPVAITVSDATGQQMTHAFELAPGEVKLVAAPPRDLPKPAPGEVKPDPNLLIDPDRVFEIKPPPLAERATATLPAAADAVCVGGGGRFLLFRLPSSKQLAALDVTAGRVVKLLPLPDADALFAAGMTKLVVYSKSAGVFVRYDLEKFEKEQTVPNPLGGTPTTLLMGHASEGPLYAAGKDMGTTTRGYGFLNPRTLTELKVPVEGDRAGNDPVSGPVPDWLWKDGGGVAVSPDGRTYAWSHERHTRVMTLSENGGRVKAHLTNSHLGIHAFGGNGTLFGAEGAFAADLKAMAGIGPAGDTKTFVPATSGLWYVTLTNALSTEAPRNRPTLQLRVSADEKVKLPLPAAADGLPPRNMDPWGFRPEGKVPVHARLHLIPEAELLAVLDDDMRRVHLHRLSAKELLARTAPDRMMVASTPLPAVRGRKWAYTPEVLTAKGGVKVTVESGPAGLKADGGTVAWDVPANFAESEATVVLTVADGGNREVFHSFKVSVRATPPPAMTVLKPVLPPIEAVKPADPPKEAAKASPAFPLKPTAAKDGTDIELPAAVDHACLAGGGRFILLRIPTKKLLAVFDVVEGKVVKELPLAEDGAVVAGGRGHVFVANPKAKMLQRWSLTTFEKEATTPLAGELVPEFALMGHASDGPLFLAGPAKFTRNPDDSPNGFYDPFTAQKIRHKRPANVRGNSDPFGRNFLSATHGLSCSPDGRVWGYWSASVSPSGMAAVILDGDTARGFYEHVSVGAVRVGAEGHLFCGGAVFPADRSRVIDAHTADVKFRDTLDDRQLFGLRKFGRTPIPAAHGPLYLWFPPEEQPKPGTVPSGTPVLKTLGVSDPLADLKDLRGMIDPRNELPDSSGRPFIPDRKKLMAYERTFLIPAAELLAVLSPDGTKLHLHAFNLRSLLEKSTAEALLLFGQPTQYAPRGKKWAYTPDVGSKKGGVKVELASGPPGMKADGPSVAWDVPADLLDTRVTVEVKVSDASGRTVTQSFILVLDETTPAPPSPTLTAEGGPAPEKKEPSGSIPTPVSPKDPSAPAPKPKDTGPTVRAALFDDAWSEYLKGTNLKPAEFRGESATVSLSGNASRGLAAGGGRYLVFHLAVGKKLVVVDLSAGAIGFEVPFEDSIQEFAANRTHLFVRNTLTNTLTRYDLTTGKSDKSIRFTFGAGTGRLIAASDSPDAPLVLVVNLPKPAAVTIDPDSLKTLPDLLDLPAAAADPIRLPMSMSPDGRRLVFQTGDLDKQEYFLGTRTGDKFTWVPAKFERPRQKQRMVQEFVLSGTGLVAWENDIYPPDGSTNLRPDEGKWPPLWRPLGSGPLIGVTAARPRGLVGFALTPGPGHLPLFTPLDDIVNNNLATHLSEPLGVVANIESRTETLYIRKFDLKKLLDGKDGKEPVLLLAPPAAERGKTFTCTPAVWAKGGERPQLTLTAGPKGMTLTEGGKLEWAVPANFADPFVTVILTATTAAGEKSALSVYPAVVGAKK